MKRTVATDRVTRFVYEIRNQRTRKLLATGESKHVVTDRDYRPARLAEHMRGYSVG